MPSNLKKIDFPYQEMKLKELYFDESYPKALDGADTEGIRTVLGRPFYFGREPEDRPYVYNSLVTSIDGKIAFPDSPQGPLIARNNQYAGKGGTVDYWILNLLRGSADAILTGTVGINAEAKTGGTGHCYDEQIECYRESQGHSPVPLGIVVTLFADDINFNAAIFRSSEKPLFFYTTKKGADRLIASQAKQVIIIDEDHIIPISEISTEHVYALVSGEEMFDHHRGLRILKRMGVNRLLVESPTVTHFFIQEKLMDELFLDYSCVYLGGDAKSIGAGCRSFTSTDHPHTKLISIYMYNPHFLYFRHQLIYGNEEAEK